MLPFVTGVAADNLEIFCTSEIDMHGGYVNGRTAVQETREACE